MHFFGNINLRDHHTSRNVVEIPAPNTKEIVGMCKQNKIFGRIEIRWMENKLKK